MHQPGALKQKKILSPSLPPKKIPFKENIPHTSPKKTNFVNEKNIFRLKKEFLKIPEKTKKCLILAQKS